MSELILSNDNLSETTITVTDTPVVPLPAPFVTDSETSVLDLSDKFFCCPKCCLHFEMAKHSIFKNHLVECDVRKKHPCENCGHIFISQSVLDYHTEHSHKNRDPLGAKPHKVKQNINIRSTDLIKVEPEEKCWDTEEDEDDEWPNDESEAQKIADKTGIWWCWICTYSSKLKNLLQKHLKRMHRDIFGNITLKCEHCEFSFFQKHHLREHLNEVHQDEIGYTCKVR